MFWKKEKEDKKGIPWNPLNSIEQLEEIKKESHEQPVMIYKHSTRCGISSMALDRLERSWDDELSEVKTYYLDLISYRDVSNAIADQFGVYHESPQVIVLKEGEAVYDASHMEISTSRMSESI